MPQIPRYIVETGVPSGTGQRYMSGEIPSAAPIVAQAAGQIAQASTSFVNAFTKANQTLTNEDMKLDIDDKVGQVKQAYGAEELRLQEQGIHPDQYPELMDKAMRRATDDATNALKYPESRGAFQLKMRPFQTEQWLKARKDALGIKYAQIGTMAEVQQQEDVNAVVFGPTPEVRQQAMDRAVGRISDLVSSGVWGGPKGSAQYEKLLAQVQEGQVLKAMDNPATRIDMLQKLDRGELTALSPQRQLELRNQQMDKLEAQLKRRDDLLEKTFNEGREMALSQVTTEALNGTMTLERFDIYSNHWRFKDTDIIRIRDIMARDPKSKEGSSTPDIYDRALVGTHTARPTVTQQQLNQWHDEFRRTNGARGLNTPDWKTMTEQLRSTSEGLRREGESDLSRTHSQAEQRLRAAIGIPDIIPAGMDAKVQRLWDQALTELTNRSNAPGMRGRENPLKVVDEIVARPGILGALGQNARRTATELGASLPTGETPQTLEQKRLTLPAAEYERRRQILQQLNELKRQEEEAAARAPMPIPRQPGFWERWFGGGTGAGRGPAQPATPGVPQRRTGPTGP